MLNLSLEFFQNFNQIASNIPIMSHSKGIKFLEKNVLLKNLNHGDYGSSIRYETKAQIYSK